MSRSKDMLSYAMDFASFLVDNLEEADLKNIRDIILFGSVARGTAEKKSDVDIFVNLVKDSGAEKRISGIADDFYGTENFSRWKRRGIDNEIKIIADRLGRWKDLNISIISDGIVLYSKYTGRAEGEQQVIIYWDKIRPESKRVLLSKKLYGYRYKKARYKGIAELTNSTKLGPNCIITDLKDAGKILDIFKENGMTAKAIYVSRL